MIRNAKALTQVVALLFAVALTGCATTQQQQGDQQENSENLESEENQQGEQLNNEGEENNLQGEDTANEGEEGSSEEGGEMVNNAGEDDFNTENASLTNQAADGDYAMNNGENMLANDGTANEGMGNEGMADEGMMNDGLANEGMAADGAMNEGMADAGADAPLDTGEAVNNAVETDSYGAFPNNNGSAMPVTDAGVNAVVDQAAAPAASPMPVATMPSGNGVVRYVVEGGTQMYQDQTGQSLVKNLDQGEHPLVYENGEWARTSDGFYIPAKGLTSRPVGRAKNPAAWQ